MKVISPQVVQCFLLGIFFTFLVTQSKVLEFAICWLNHFFLWSFFGIEFQSEVGIFLVVKVKLDFLEMYEQLLMFSEFQEKIDDAALEFKLSNDTHDS